MEKKLKRKTSAVKGFKKGDRVVVNTGNADGSIPSMDSRGTVVEMLTANTNLEVVKSLYESRDSFERKMGLLEELPELQRSGKIAIVDTEDYGRITVHIARLKRA